MTLTVSPEQALLVRAAAPPGRPIRVTASSGHLSWERAVESAEWHRLSPLLWRCLREAQDGVRAPAVSLDALRQAARATTASNMNLQVQLDRVVGALTEVDVPVMLLKGAALIETVYPSVGLRPMDDLDLLVPRSKIERAFAAVEALGYEAPAARFRPDAAMQLQASHQHYSLIQGGSGVVIELHHHISTAWPHFDIAGFWERAVPKASGKPYLVPCPEDLLLHVAVHFTVDRVERRPCALGQVADLAWIVAGCDIDWSALARRASDYGVADRLFLALFTVRRLFGDVIPEAVVVDLKPRSYRRGIGEEFVRQRVLRAHSALPLERITELRRLILPGHASLAAYVAVGETTSPSGPRLFLRRAVALVRKLFTSLGSPRELLDDIRLSRWIRSLRS